VWERGNCWISTTWLGQSILPPPFHGHDDLKTKAARIEACLSRSPVDLWELRELALSKGGLLTRKSGSRKVSFVSGDMDYPNYFSDKPRRNHISSHSNLYP